jgi:membrane protease YdiL (CAAX protease family)
MRDLRELVGWLRENAGLLWLATVGAFGAHWSAHGPPAHLVLLPSLAVAVFAVVPLAGAIVHDAPDRLTAALALAAAAVASVPAMAWVDDAQHDAIRADPSWVVAWSLAGVGGVVAAAVVGRWDPTAWGLGAGDVRWWAPKVGLVLGAVAVGVVCAAWAFPGFVAFYPRYEPGRHALGPLVQFQLAMGLFAACWEFFYRGFLLFGLARHTSPTAAIVVQAIPFYLVHLGKPIPELVASWFGGIAIGWLAWRARAIWPAFLLHWAQYSGMEIAAYVLRSVGVVQ